MRKSTVLLGIFSLACALAAIGAWRELGIERARVAQLERQLAEQQTASQQRAAAVTSAAAAPAMPASSALTESASAAAKPKQELTEEEAKELASRREIMDHMRRAAQREREMLRDPAYRQSQFEDMRRRYASMRADAIRVVGMTPEQADRVIDLQTERNMRFSELGGIPGQPPDEAMQAELKRAGEAEQAALRKLLGDELYAKWTRYLASGQERAEADMWRAQLSTTGEALTDSQAHALADSLYVERERRSREYEEYVKSAGIVDRNVVAPQDRQRWLDLEKEANQRTHDTMAATLSPAQLASLDQMLAARLAPVEAALRMQLEGRVAKSK